MSQSKRQPKRTGRRAAARLATTTHASAPAAFLPHMTTRTMRRGRQRLPAAASADAMANFAAVLEFTQPNGKAEIDYDPTGISTDHATFEVWIKTTVKTPQFVFQTAGSQPDIYIQNDQIGLNWAGASNGGGWLGSDTRPISDGEWHHIAVVLNNGTINFYKDGILTNDTWTVNNAANGNHPVFMGGTWAGIPAFIGQMWNIRIWAQVLTAAQIQADMRALTPAGYVPGVTPVRLISAFNVANNTFTNIINNATGTLTNCEVTWDVLPPSPTYAFQIPGGGGDYVDITNGSMTPVSSTAATFECWIQMSDATGVSATPQTILLCRGSDPSGASPRIEYDGGDKLGTFWNAPGAYSADTRPISDGAWHHIAVVFNNNQVTFLKDGIPTNETLALSATQTSGGDLQVGPALGSTQGFNGLVTDVRMWSVARSVGDIQSNMYATLTGAESGLVALNNLSYYNPNDPANNGVKNQVNGGGTGFVAGNAKVVEVVGPQSQQPVPQNVWTYPITGTAPLGPQISPKGLIYGENVDAGVNGQGGSYLRSLDLQTNALNWTYTINPNNDITTPVIPASVAVGNGVAYVAAQDTSGGNLVELHSVDLDTGKLVWPNPARLTTNYVLTNPVEAGNIVVIGTPSLQDGGAGVTVFLVDTALGQQVQNVDVPMTQLVDYMSDPLIQTASSTNGPITMAYFVVKHLGDTEGNYSAVVALNLSTQRVVWQKNFANLLQGGMAIDQDRLYTTTEDGAILALNLSDGSTVWTKTKSASHIRSKPVIIGTAVYVGSTDGNLYALDGATGNELWRLDVGSAITTDLITEDGAIYFATQGNGQELPPTFYSVDANSFGNDVLIYPVPDADTILFDQGQSNGVVYFYSQRNVYAVNMDMILHEFNVDTKLQVEDYDTTSSTPNPNPTGNDTAYRITLALNDPLKVPRVNQAIKVWASGPVYLSNRLDASGKPIQIGPNTPLWSQTDGSGQVSLALSAYDDGSHGGTGSSTTTPLVNCPAIYAWANFMMPGEAIVIYPDHEHMGNLSNVQGVSSTLQAARSHAVQGTLYLNQATTYDGSQLISSGYQDSNSLGAIAATIRNTIGTRNSGSVSAPKGIGDAAPANKYIAYPASMPNVNYASDNTQPTTRPYAPGTDQTFTVNVPTSGTPTYQPGVFDPPTYVGQASASPQSVENALSIGDFFNKVIKGEEKVTKMAWTWASNAVNTVIQTAENIYQLTITTLEDAVTAVVGFLKSVVADLKKVIEWLSALFDWKAIISNHTLIKQFITDPTPIDPNLVGFVQMQAWIKNEINVLGTAESYITNVFNSLNGKGQSSMTTTGQGVAGQTVQSQQGPNSNPNDAYNTGGNNNATQCKWLHHKTMENGAGVGAPTPVRPRHVYLPWVSQAGATVQPRSASSVLDGPDAGTILQAFETFFESVGKTIASDFVGLPDKVKAAITTLKDKFKDPKSVLANAFTDVLAVLAVLADDLIGLGVEIAKDFLTFVDTMLVQLWAFVNQTVDILFVSPFYKSLTGDDLTVLDLVALIGAVPTTILMEVITGSKTPPTTARIAMSQPLRGEAGEMNKLLQIYLGIYQFNANAIGAVIDAFSFNLNGTEGVTAAKQNLASRVDAAKGLFTWVLGMAVSQAWNTWQEHDWVYWFIQAFPVFYNLYTLYEPIPMISVVNLDAITGIMILVSSAICAAVWPSSYLNGPRAPGLVLTANLFNSFGYLIELVYYAQSVISNELAAAAGAAGKLLMEEVNAILGFVAYALTVAHSTSTSTAIGFGVHPALSAPAATLTPAVTRAAMASEAPNGSTRRSLSFA